AGIGSAVYTFLIVTPLHNVLISVALLFFATAIGAVLHLLRREQEMKLYYCGLGCLGSLTLSAVMYYGNLMYSLLPVVQKVSFVSTIAWLVVIHCRVVGQHNGKISGPERG